MIRSEAESDEAAIEAVTIAAFSVAEHAAGTEQFIVRSLRDADALTVSLVAETEGVIVGHVAVSPVTVSDGTAGWYGLGPISVEPAYQRRGIGSQLMHEALRRLREAGANGCMLVGDPEYYGRFGFRSDARLVYPGVPPQYFQILSFGGEVPEGFVTFHEAFNATA